MQGFQMYLQGTVEVRRLDKINQTRTRLLFRYVTFYYGAR